LNIFKTATLYHLSTVQQCLRKYRAEATVNMADLVMQVHARNRHYSFYPQLLGRTNGQLRYTTQFDEGTIGFKGWLPYTIKRWPISSSKLAFKDFCRRNGLRTPAMWRSSVPEMRDFVVKKENSSFGQALRGPFASHDPKDPVQAIDESGYYEAFIRGRIVKAMYWEGRLACVEILDMPTVKGDGSSSVRQLITRRFFATAPAEEWLIFGGVVAYEGMTLDSIPAAGESVLIDFRYGSNTHPVSYTNTNACKEIAGSALMAQLVACGPVLWQGIPETVRPATLFSVDAIVDEREQLWLLEMNSNPVCHPDVYPLMMDSLFGTADAINAPPSPPASALPGPASTPQGPSVALPQFAQSSRGLLVC
jgi:hypothetical protein